MTRYILRRLIQAVLGQMTVYRWLLLITGVAARLGRRAAVDRHAELAGPGAVQAALHVHRANGGIRIGNRTDGAVGAPIARLHVDRAVGVQRLGSSGHHAGHVVGVDQRANFLDGKALGPRQDAEHLEGLVVVVDAVVAKVVPPDGDVAQFDGEPLYEHARAKYTRPGLSFARDLVQTWAEPVDAVVFLPNGGNFSPVRLGEYQRRIKAAVRFAKTVGQMKRSKQAS